MAFSISINSVQGRPGPERALSFRCQLRWLGDPAFITGITGSLQYLNQTVCDHLVCDAVSWPDGGEQSLVQHGNREILATVVAPLTSEAISFIERQRTDDVNFTFNVRYGYQVAIKSANGKGQSILVAGPTYWRSTTMGYSVSHSDWLRRLKEMEWTETEIFEIPTIALHEDKNLAEALRLLKDAHTTLRVHDHKGVLVKCREALESAAKYEAQGDTRKGFELLLLRAFPEHEAKCDKLNSLIHAFSEFAHTLGRHAQYPALHVTRAEAEFALATTTALFSLIGRRLSGKETI